MTLDELNDLCKQAKVPGTAELVMWDGDRLDPVGSLVFAGPNPRDADAPDKHTVQLWPAAGTK